VADRGKSSCRSGHAGGRSKKPRKSRLKIVEAALSVGIVGVIPLLSDTSSAAGNSPRNLAGMPLARHPDPEEVDCLLRNGELRTAIEPYLDESIWEVDFRSMPTPVENRFLESMLAWELAPLTPVARWFEPQLAMQPVCTLDDEQVHERLWQTIDALYEKRIVLDFTDHLSDREFYSLIRRDILPAKIKQIDVPDNYVHWDCSATTEGDESVWLVYYASDEEREEWRLEEGRDPPPKLVPPYPRALPIAP
jgi:hypothetical protein